MNNIIFSTMQEAVVVPATTLSANIMYFWASILQSIHNIHDPVNILCGTRILGQMYVIDSKCRKVVIH